jgi:uncharacterized membrane protein
MATIREGQSLTPAREHHSPQEIALQEITCNRLRFPLMKNATARIPPCRGEIAMTLLTLGLVLFLGAHLFTTLREPRAAAIARFGEAGYKAAYSVISVIGLVLIAYGFGVYRSDGWITIWNPPVWTRHFALLITLPVFILLAVGKRPSWLKAVTRHPMLLAVKLWATAHLFANGDLGSMLLFGGFLAWAVMARISAKRRPDETASLAAMGRPAFGRRDIIVIVVGLAAYVAMVLWLHPLLIGVPVITRS